MIKCVKLIEPLHALGEHSTNPMESIDTVRPKMAHVTQYSVLLLKQKVNDARCRKGSRMLIAIKLVQRSLKSKLHEGIAMDRSPKLNVKVLTISRRISTVCKIE